MPVKGRIHSVETAGALDGPGMRYVLFMSGCPFRCKFCHNPDTWASGCAHEKSAGEVLEDVLKYEPFFKYTGGGVTASGGEPTLQAEFLLELFKMLKGRGIHTALDTCGHCALSRDVRELLDFADLVMLDIKHLDPVLHGELTGRDNSLVMAFLGLLERMGKRTWIRAVLVPGLTDSAEYAARLAEFVSGFRCVEKTEILPYHDMGRAKWEAMGMRYPMGGAKPVSRAAAEAFRAEFERLGLNTSLQG